MANDEHEPQTDDAKGREEAVHDEAPVTSGEEPARTDATPPVVGASKVKSPSRISRLLATRRRKVLAVIGVAVFVTVLLAAIPVTRYAVFGLAVKKDVAVTVTDATTKKPVTDAAVTLGSHTAVTDKDGTARLIAVPAGQYDLKVSKKYYAGYTAGFLVPIVAAPSSPRLAVNATGRPVSFTVSDRISGAPLADVTLAVSGTNATTDKNGEATVVVPDKGDIKGTLSAKGYNDAAVTLAIDDAGKNAFGVTRSGQIVFLNNGNGTIDVRRSNLDGSDSSVIVAGTGKENRYSTALLSARDWQYSVLKASRDSDNEKLYLVTTKDGALTDVDEGDATFTLVGWLGHTFYYVVNRNVDSWNDKANALKSYNADTGKLATLDETSGSGTGYYDAVYQSFGSVYLLNDEAVYAKYWYAGYSPNLGDKNMTVYSIAANTGKKTSVKDFAAQNTNLSLSLYEPQGLYIRYAKYDGKDPQYYEYEDGAVKSVDAPQGDFFDYPTYLASPSDKKTFWYELRNGKNTLFIGNDDGNDAKQVANLSEFIPYGWYGSNDDYVLFTKKGSELYIAPAGVPIDDATAVKVTDYYKVQSYNGYGKGYGGQ